MKIEGFEFPSEERISDAMFMGQSAPEWIDNSVCYRCRAQFSAFSYCFLCRLSSSSAMLNRKHHCRACGQIFCVKCSSNFIPLPHIGIEEQVCCLKVEFFVFNRCYSQVRVCETCNEKHAPKERLVSTTVPTQPTPAPTTGGGQTKQEAEHRVSLGGARVRFLILRREGDS